MPRKILPFLLLVSLLPLTPIHSQEPKPVTVAIARMTHDHIAFILDRLRRNSSDLKLVGIWEPDKVLVEKYSAKYKLDKTLFYDDLDKMLDKTHPESVLAFGSIHEHLGVVKACAPLGIHVMVEKPLAVNMDHARQMKDLAVKYKIHLLTDFETSWYPSSTKSWQLVNDSSYVGNLRKVVLHDGHQGPKEIGCSKEFLSWLTDPVLNGGGAIIDFGCYGANIMTWLKQGELPVSVTAVTRQYKPDVYPKVDDDATIILNYANSECIIQASWNWPFGRKDMEIYGNKGYIIADNRNDMRLRNSSMKTEVKRTVTGKDVAVYEDPFSYFIDVVRGRLTPAPHEPYSLENNITVVKILDAGRESAKTGKTVYLKKE
ncbi:MAG: Gfo/Idh/MocA family oxidoreductase [Bacteroidales bacterium]